MVDYATLLIVAEMIAVTGVDLDFNGSLANL